MKSSFSNAFISTLTEQKSDLILQWTLHVSYIFDQKLFCFEVQHLSGFYVFSDHHGPKLDVQAQKLRLNRETASAVLIVHVSAVL